MARCGCSGACQCTLDGGSCIRVTGSGSLADPYSLEITVDPDAGNIIECRPNGLFASSGIAVFVDDTSCIDLGGNGTEADPLVASPVIDPDATNLLRCEGTGLVATLTVDDTDCISLSGAGTVADPLVATPVIDPGPGNLLTCEPTGLHASTSGFRYVTSVIDSGDSPYVATYNHAIVADKGGGDIGITLPSIGGPSSDGASVLVRVIGGAANTCAIYPTGGALVNGAASLVVANGTQTHLIAVNGDWYSFDS